MHFGLGTTTTLDSVVVEWPSGLRSVELNVASNDTLTAPEPQPLFTNVAASAGVENSGGSYNVGWADYDNDGDYDLYVLNNAATLTNVLYNNDGAVTPTFSSVSTAAGVSAPSAFATWGVTWGDYDGDGDVDLFTSNNGAVADYLFQNDGDGTFTDVAVSAGVDDSAVGSRDGIWGDADGDGDLDLYVVKTNNDNRLWINDGAASPTFSDGAVAAGVGNGTLGGDRSAVWADYDNDGFQISF